MNDTASAAAAYIARGWAVVALHDVTGGACSCGSADEPRHSMSQGGKHPLGRGWQNAGVRDTTIARDMWAARPGANIGIITGRASGIWVLDVDPEHGGDAKLAALVGAYGPLPETFTVQTGSGGRHYYWAMPDFDFTTSRGQLPVGLDVRGNSGQVVAPPSYTLKGPYRVLVDAPVVPAPGWLLSMIRPKVPEAGAAMAGVDPGVAGPGIAGEVMTTTALGAGRGQDYARAAVVALLGDLAAAPPGSRNDTAYRVGRRLAELVNSPWSGLDVDQVFAGYMHAALLADVDGAFSQTEAEQVLRKAVWAQGGRGVDLPAADFYGTAWSPGPVFPPGMIPPGNTDASHNGGGPGSGGPASDFDQAGQGPAANPFASPGTDTSAPVAAPLINGYGEQPKQADPWEDAVNRELSRLLVRREAEKRLGGWGKAPTDFGQICMDDAALAQVPGPEELVTGYLDLDTLARVNGPSGHGKSFVVLDLAACVATGRAWHGHTTRQVRVCYVVAEGVRGMSQRARAWCERAQVDSTGVTFIPEPVQVGGPDWGRFVLWCSEQDFGLIVIDTQARATVGVDENDATEMGEVIAQLDVLRAATGACVTLIHHRGLRGEHGRGSTAVRGALDVELDVSRQGLTVTVKSVKQKDREDPPAKHFTMTPLGASMVLVGDLEGLPGSPFVSPAGVPQSLRDRCAIAIAHALREASGSGLTKAEAMTHARVALDLGADETTKRTVRRAWSDLQKLGRLAKADGREAYFFLELDGAPILNANPDKRVEGGPERYVP